MASRGSSITAPIVAGDTLTFQSQVTDIYEKKRRRARLLIDRQTRVDQPARRACRGRDPRRRRAQREGATMTAIRFDTVQVGDLCRQQTFAADQPHDPGALSPAPPATTIPSTSTSTSPSSAGMPDVFAHGMLVDGASRARR